ncbi:sulfite exporter TauE/SafE family protein [Pseudaestuariivita atlantica]|uniref:Probable membrane transporter protein n=1 Tax=Pseudaestuariivita atlantica TaxID=1317121 RepID=A0A0L1JRK5_9RHOB|nr:sulfite exporter TauE/SafE family protein [Pseudaestuariivita atlantica]KNG94385.1 membrane protein [Pseudaestuariivita atlantica]
MDPFSWSFVAIGGVAMVFAGISKGGFGSGASFAGASILALIIAPGEALGIMLPLLMLIDALTLKPFWKQWDWVATRGMILGAVPGVALGAVFYTLTNDDAIRLMIGAMSLLYVATQLPAFLANTARTRRSLPRWMAYLAGTVSGFTSFVSHAGGPPAAMYMLSLGLSKTAYQASSVLLFWAVNIFKAVPYAFLGIFTVETLTIDLILAPFAVVGTFLGIWLHRRIPERPFFVITFILLTVTGSKLIWDALV